MKKILSAVVALFLAQILFSQTPDFQWVKNIGGVNGEYCYSNCVDLAGNTYSVGIFYGTVDFDPGAGVFNLSSAGYNDGFILKLDANGNFVWADRVGGVSYDYFYGITCDGNNNIFVTGEFSDTVDFDPGPSVLNFLAAPYASSFVLKLDLNGDFVWSKPFGTGGYASGNSIAVDATGNILVTGSFQGTPDFDPGASTFTYSSSVPYSDAFVLKLNSSGGFVWAKAVGGAGVYDIGVSVGCVGAGNVFVSGSFQGTVDFDPGTGVANLTSPGGSEVFVMKLDPAGNYSWAGQFKGAGNERIYQMKVDVNGSTYTTGSFDGPVDFDPGATVDNVTALSWDDMFLVKLDSSGNYSWLMHPTSDNGDVGLCVDVDRFGAVYCEGTFGGNCDFDPGPGVFTLSATSGTTYILKLDPGGNFIWAGKMEGASDVRPYSIAVDQFGGVYSSGSWSGTNDFDPSPVVYNVNAEVGGSQDHYVMKMVQPFFGIEKYSSSYGLKIYPNPTNDYVNIVTEKETRINIVDMLGQVILFSNLTSNLSLNVSGLSSGIYFVKDLGNGSSVKFIKY